MTPCDSNPSYLNQAYGDITGVNVTFATHPSFTFVSMSYWAGGYSDLTDVGYGDEPVLTFAAAPGYTVTLSSFDLGSDGGTPVLITGLTVTDLATNTLLVYSPFTTTGPTKDSFLINATSSELGMSSLISTDRMRSLASCWMTLLSGG